jgi:hypothetical protein
MLLSCPLWYHDAPFPFRLTWCCTKHAPFHQPQCPFIQMIDSDATLLPLKFSSPLEHCIPDGFRPRGHSLHAFALPFVRHSGCADGPLSTFWWQLSCSLGLGVGSFRGSPRCALTLTMNVRVPCSTLSLTHSMIVFMMSAFASPASVVRGPLPIHLDTLSRVVPLSHKYGRSTSGGVACGVRDTAANLAVVS